MEQATASKENDRKQVLGGRANTEGDEDEPFENALQNAQLSIKVHHSEGY